MDVDPGLLQYTIWQSIVLLMTGLPGGWEVATASRCTTKMCGQKHHSPLDMS